MTVEEALGKVEQLQADLQWLRRKVEALGEEAEELVQATREECAGMADKEGAYYLKEYDTSTARAFSDLADAIRALGKETK